MTRLSRTFLIAVAVALLSPVTAAAAEPWNPPRTIDRASGGERLGVAAVGLDRRGNALAAWTRGNSRRARLMGSRADARTLFSDPFTLRGFRRSMDSPSVEFTDNGTAIVSYRRLIGRNYRIATTRVRRDGTFFSSQILSGSGGSAFFPEFAQPVTARPVLWWLRGPGGEPGIQFSRASRAGVFSSTLRYDIPGATRDVDLTVGADGALYAAVVRRDPATGVSRVYVARQAPGERAVTLQQVSDGTRFPREPRVNVTASRTVVAWTESEGTSERLVVSDRTSPLGEYSAPRVVARGGFMSQLKVISSGDQIVAGWVASPRGPAYAQRSGRLRMTRLVPAGTRSLITTIQVPIDGFALDGDGRGGVTAAFLGTTGRIFAVAITRSGTVGVGRELTRPRERAVNASLSVGARGDAVVAWVTAGGRHLRIARRLG